MRRFVDSVRQVLSAIWAHKLRSFLTMFGIAWGVGSLLLLIGLGEGFRAGTKKNLERARAYRKFSVMAGDVFARPAAG